MSMTTERTSLFKDMTRDVAVHQTHRTGDRHSFLLTAKLGHILFLYIYTTKYWNTNNAAHLTCLLCGTCSRKMQLV